MKKIIEEKIIKEFSPTFLEIINNSHLHSKHFQSEISEIEGQTHFMIRISSQSFKNLSKVECHRRINKVLKEEFKNGLHALEIKIINSN